MTFLSIAPEENDLKMNIATILLESNTQFTPMKTSDVNNLEIEGKCNATT